MLRYVFNSGFTWALELTTIFFAAMIFVGISYRVRIGAHIGVDALVSRLPPVARGAGIAPWMFLLVVNFILLMAGNFMEPTGIILILAPIFFPIATELGIDPIHLGIIMVVNMEIGMITPPVGLNLFVTSGITGMNLVQVTKAALPWLSVLLIFLVLVTYIPQISLFLPNLLFN